MKIFYYTTSIEQKAKQILITTCKKGFYVFLDIIKNYVQMQIQFGLCLQNNSEKNWYIKGQKGLVSNSLCAKKCVKASFNIDAWFQ